MINVTPSNAKKDDNSRVKSKLKSHSAKVGESFNTVLTDRIAFEFQGSIDELLNDLKEEERDFLSNQSLYYLNRYRSVVEKLLKVILNEGFETQKLKRLRRDKADFIIVKKINDKLFEIVREITNRNNKAFNLLKSVEEIRGLVFDLIF